jgi:Protein of unknown function (DUF2934)
MSKQVVKRVRKPKAVVSMDTMPGDPAKMDPIRQLERREMIAREAYLLAEQRGFDGGDPVADWLEAEAVVDRMLNMHQ